MQQGDNVIGIPLGIPQVSKGAHYLSIFLKVDNGTLIIPKFNLQCMIDGRNLQGGLSAEPPHAECKEAQALVNINGLYYDKVHEICKEIKLQKPHTSSRSDYQKNNIDVIKANKNLDSNFSVYLKKYGDMLYFNKQYKDKFSFNYEVLNIDDEGFSFKTVYKGLAVKKSIDSGVMYSLDLIDISLFSNIEKLEVR